MRFSKVLLKSKDRIVTLFSIMLFSTFFRGKVTIGRSARFVGMPSIIALGQSIEIGEELRLASSTLSNLLGVNHRVIIATISNGKIQIGNNFRMSGGSIVARCSIIIGNNVNVGVNCIITDSDHHAIEYSKRGLESSKDIATRPVIIGDDVWLGANVTILKGVTIGSRSIVGAGLTVKKSIPADHICTESGLRIVKNGD